MWYGRPSHIENLAIFGRYSWPSRFFWAIRPNFDHDSDSKGNQRDLPSHGHDRICDLGQQIYMIGGKRFTPIRSRTWLAGTFNIHCFKCIFKLLLSMLCVATSIANSIWQTNILPIDQWTENYANQPFSPRCFFLLLFRFVYNELSPIKPYLVPQSMLPKKRDFQDAVRVCVCVRACDVCTKQESCCKVLANCLISIEIQFLKTNGYEILGQYSYMSRWKTKQDA